MKFEKDFDFESANAQFNKEEIDREFQSKLKLKGICCFDQIQYDVMFSAGNVMSGIFVTVSLL